MPQSLITHKPWLQSWERKSRSCCWSPTWMWHLGHQLQSEAHENGAGSAMEQQNPTRTHMETWDSGQASNSPLMLLVEGRHAGVQRSTGTAIRQLRAPSPAWHVPGEALETAQAFPTVTGHWNRQVWDEFFVLHFTRVWELTMRPNSNSLWRDSNRLTAGFSTCWQLELKFYL